MKPQARLRLRQPINPVYTPSGTPVICSCGGFVFGSILRDRIIYQCMDCSKFYDRA
jgi:hypothetical protein